MLTASQVFLSNTTVVLYGLQASTYLFAAVFSRLAAHNALTVCYAVSAMVHATLAVCHFMMVG